MRRKVIGILHLGLSLLGEKMERLLAQKEAEIERLRGLLEAEIEESHTRESAYRGDVSCLRHALKEAAAESDRLHKAARDAWFAAAGRADELKEARKEVARLRDLHTPRTGDSVPHDVLWWAPSHRAGREWRRLRGDLLDPGDIWLPMPPPPESVG